MYDPKTHGPGIKGVNTLNSHVPGWKKLCHEYTVVSGVYTYMPGVGVPITSPSVLSVHVHATIDKIGPPNPFASTNIIPAVLVLIFILNATVTKIKKHIVLTKMGRLFMYEKNHIYSILSQKCLTRKQATMSYLSKIKLFSLLTPFSFVTFIHIG